MEWDGKVSPDRSAPEAPRLAGAFVAPSNLGRCASPGRVDWAHESDLPAVGIFDDGVSRSPEGVVGRLQTLVPRADKIGVCYILVCDITPTPTKI